MGPLVETLSGFRRNELASRFVFVGSAFLQPESWSWLSVDFVAECGFHHCSRKPSRVVLLLRDSSGLTTHTLAASTPRVARFLPLSPRMLTAKYTCSTNITTIEVYMIMVWLLRLQCVVRYLNSDLGCLCNFYMYRRYQCRHPAAHDRV